MAKYTFAGNRDPHDSSVIAIIVPSPGGRVRVDIGQEVDLTAELLSELSKRHLFRPVHNSTSRRGC